MAIPEFLANKFAPLYFSSIVGYLNQVPSFHEWNTYLPRFSGDTDRRPDQHLEDFHECMEHEGIFLEDVQMKLFMYSLGKDARVWYKTIPHGNIYSLKCFHIAFNHYCKILYPPNSLFEHCSAHFRVENILEVNDPTKDVFETPLQEDIYWHQEAVPNDQESKEETSSSYK